YDPAFSYQYNWDDITDALNPAAYGPTSLDTVEFIGGGRAVNGTGTGAALSFSGNGAWTLTTAAALISTGSVVVGSTQPAVVAIDAASGLTAKGGGPVVIASTAGASGSAVNLSGAGSYLQTVVSI